MACETRSPPEPWPLGLLPCDPAQCIAEVLLYSLHVNFDAESISFHFRSRTFSAWLSVVYSN